MDKKIDDIENKLNNIEIALEKINNNIELLHNNINSKQNIDNEVLQECKKMGAHIDFIENVYDNVKNPLGYICNKIRYVTRNDTTHLLTDASYSNYREKD